MAYQGKPAYQQIADDIRQRILDGALRAGDRLPTEVDLMAEYGVSRIVVRGAVELLSNEGLVKKEQGRGTFVRDQRPRNAASRVTSTASGRSPRP